MNLMHFCLQHLQKELPPQIEADPETLFSAAFNVKYNAKKMKKLEKDYAAMKTKEQEEMVELRVSFQSLFPTVFHYFLVNIKKNIRIIEGVYWYEDVIAELIIKWAGNQSIEMSSRCKLNS